MRFTFYSAAAVAALLAAETMAIEVEPVQEMYPELAEIDLSDFDNDEFAELEVNGQSLSDLEGEDLLAQTRTFADIEKFDRGAESEDIELAQVDLMA